MRSILDIIDSHRDSDAPAHILRNTVTSYRQLCRKSDILADYLHTRLKENHKPVAVFGHKDPLMIICFLAVAKTGRAYVPIDISAPKHRVKDILSDSCCRMILATDDFDIDTDTAEVLKRDDLQKLTDAYSDNAPLRETSFPADTPFYIMYTSGSTGKPKGVVVTLQNISSFVHWSLSICKCNDASVFLNQAPFSFDLSVMDLYTSLASRSTLFSIDRPAIENLQEALALLAKSNITHWVSTPSFADLCLSTRHFNDRVLPRLRMALFCGEVLSGHTVRKIRERFVHTEVINLYGPTEATVAVAAVPITEEMLKNPQPLPVGYCKDDCYIEISGARNDGERGEILVFGESVALGYHENLGLTARKFLTKNQAGRQVRGYRTGDKGYLQDNLLYYCGRTDFQIKLNGYRIELEDIENNIRNCDGVRNAIVLPKYADARIMYLVAFVTLENATADIPGESLRIRQELALMVPAYMIPRKITIAQSLPMNANGKVNRQSLKEVVENGSI